MIFIPANSEGSDFFEGKRKRKLKREKNIQIKRENRAKKGEK